MNKFLQKAIEEASVFATKPVPDQGFTTYSGNSISDKEYPNLFNILISLNLQTLEKLEQLEKKQSFSQELDKISESLSKLSLGEPVVRQTYKPEIYKFWIPKS